MVKCNIIGNEKIMFAIIATSFYKRERLNVLCPKHTVIHNIEISIRNGCMDLVLDDVARRVYE